MKKLYFLRHGESQANVDGIYAGFTQDTPLTAKGRAEAIGAIEAIASLGIERIISSSSVRALDTARIVAGGINFPLENIQTDDRLREPELGKLVGTPAHGLQGYLDAAREPGNPYQVETLDGLRNRIVEFIGDNLADNANVTLVVGHNGSGLILQSVLMGRTDINNLSKIPNCQVVELERHEN